MRVFFTLLVFAAVPVAAQTGNPEDIITYNAGFETAEQLIAQDPAFDFGRFRAGFARGLTGDSTEIAYALGLRAGLGISADTVSNINADMFLRGIRERSEGRRSRVTPTQVATASAAFQDAVEARQLRARAQTDPAARVRLDEIRDNAASARSFLAEVARRPGVKKTNSGVLYIITKSGGGASPTDADQVEIRYEGKFADGTTFDKSPEGETATLPVGALVPGFSEMLKAMKPGETRTFWLPPNLAYGLQGAAPPPNDDGSPGTGGIPPNAAIEFEVTLVRILP